MGMLEGDHAFILRGNGNAFILNVTMLYTLFPLPSTLPWTFILNFILL